MIKSEQVATFRLINLNLSQGLSIPFLARLYFDGEHRKLALISQEDILLFSGNDDSRMWPGFIYTLTNESTELRKIIEEDIIRDSANLSNSQPRILQPLEYSQLGKVVLRPARPLDIYYLDENINYIDPTIKNFLSGITI